MWVRAWRSKPNKLTMVLAYYRHRYEDLPPESQEEFQARVRRATEDQERAAERRKQEDARRREQREEERAKGTRLTTTFDIRAEPLLRAKGCRSTAEK